MPPTPPYSCILACINPLSSSYGRWKTRTDSNLGPPPPNHLARVALNLNLRVPFYESYGFHRVKSELDSHTRQKLHSQQIPCTKALGKHTNQFGLRNGLGNTPDAQRNCPTHHRMRHCNNKARKTPTGLSPDVQETEKDPSEIKPRWARLKRDGRPTKDDKCVRLTQIEA